MFEHDGFLCIAFGVFDFNCVGFVITFNRYSQYGFFQWLAIVILKNRIVIPINTKYPFFLNPQWDNIIRIFLTIFINIYPFYRDNFIREWLFIFINNIQIEHIFTVNAGGNGTNDNYFSRKFQIITI